MGTKDKRYIKDDGGKTMKGRKDISLRGALGLIAIVLIMLLVQVPAQGVMNCTDDSDCDGITTAQETSIPQCLLGSGQVTQTLCDPNTKDLFVIFLPCGDPKNTICTTGTKLPDTTPLSTLITDASRDLAIKVHQINPTQTYNNSDRNVTDTQEAMRIFENTDTTGTALGETPVGGNPNTASDASVYTRNIINFVDSKCVCGPTQNTCTNGNLCVAADGTTGEANVIAKYIKHTIAHEAGHEMALKATCSTDIGCHYPTPTSSRTTPTHLDYAVYWTQSSSHGVTTTKFYIGSQYYMGSPTDASGVRLR